MTEKNITRKLMKGQKVIFIAHLTTMKIKHYSKAHDLRELYLWCPYPLAVQISMVINWENFPISETASCAEEKVAESAHLYSHQLCKF